MSKQAPTITDPTGRGHLLDESRMTIGRAPECSIVITSKRISREHAVVEREGWRTMLADLNSTNGTFLNGVRISQEIQLQDGDKFMVGDVLFTFNDPDVTFQDSLLATLDVDEASGEVRVDRQPVELSPKEFDLVVYMDKRRGQVCSKDEIGTAVWPEYQDGVYDYQIENLVRRLRTKLEADPATPKHLITVRGRGYKLV